MTDLSILRIAKHRQDYYRIKGRIPDAVLDPQTRAILDDYGKYFEAYPNDKVVDMEVFLPMFRTWHSGLTKEQNGAYTTILQNAQKDLPEDKRNGIMRSVLELRLATDLANLASRFEEGDLPNLFSEVQESIREFKADANIQTEGWIRTPIQELMKEDVDETGLKSRLECIQMCTRPYRPGDFLVVAGRPDKGKTTFIASEITHMAGQLPPDQNVLWLNNEGMGKRLIPRLYQAALGATKSQLIQLMQKGVIEEAYERVVGRIDRIRVQDVHGKDNFSIEQIIEQNNVGLVVYDMVDNIRGFGDAARTDLGLERMYQWARETAVEYGHVAIATSQISNEGDGLQWPTLGMLKDSKTGKQGAADVQIMIGASNDPGYAGVRFISMPKNKLKREGVSGDPRATVKYDPDRARYTDLPITMENKDAEDE